MAYENNSNKKHPLIQFKGKYPNIYVTQGIDGYQLIRSLEPGNEAFFEIMPSGSYRSHGPKGEEVRVTMGKKHEYGADGASRTYDGHVDEKVGGTHRQAVDGSKHTEVAGNKFEAGGGIAISGTKDSKIDSQTQGDKFETTKGSLTTERTGNVHSSIIGDYVASVDGQRHETIKTGEYGIHVQDGSYDLRIETGKSKFYSLDDMLSESTTKITNMVGASSNTIMTPSEITIQTTKKITIQVGGSKIEITPSGIKMTAPRIDLN